VPYCPECRTEYLSGIGICSDCKAELVEALPPDQTRADAPLAVLATFPNSAGAHLVLELLEQNGIPAVLRGDVDPIGNVVSAVAPALLVEKPDLARAQEIYNAFFAGESNANELADGGDIPESTEER